MIWKTFLISFMLNTGKHKKLILWDMTYANSVPRKQRSYSDDMENITETSQPRTMRTENKFFSKPGYDNRYNHTDNDTDIILNITKFNRQMELLRILEKNGTSQHVKLELIEKYNKDENQSPLIKNIFHGGLYKDWDFNIEK